MPPEAIVDEHVTSGQSMNRTLTSLRDEVIKLRKIIHVHDNVLRGLSLVVFITFVSSMRLLH
jgi:hypothetical protein